MHDGGSARTDAPIAVEAEGEDLYEVIHRAARKLERAITRRLERRRSRQAA